MFGRYLGFVEQRVRTEFGYFAENTLEDLRLNSFRDKDLISCPLIASTSNSVQRQTKKRELKTYSNKQNISLASTSRAVQLRNCTKLSTPPLTKSIIVIASDEDSEEELIDGNTSQVSYEDSVVSNQSEELDENHPLMKYENRNYWCDKDYQITCFKQTIQMLKNDRSDRFKDALKLRALQTINLPSLPSGANIVPIIRYNSKGEPHFEFHFLVKDSPLAVRDVIKVDDQIVFHSQIIYEWITLPSKPKSCQKRLIYNRRQLDFNN